MRGKTRMVKKWLCLLLAAAMLLGMLPGRSIVRAQTETPVRTGEDLDDASDIFNLEMEEPEELDRFPEDVYGQGKNRPFRAKRTGKRPKIRQLHRRQQ